MSNRFFTLPRFVLYADSTGKPLQGGRVYFYESGTTTLKTIYTDYDRTIEAENPVILDKRGEGLAVLGVGAYSIRVEDSAGRDRYTEDDITASDDTVVSYGAIGDGQSDDTVALQAAADSGLAVYIPHGTYKLTSNINVTSSLWSFWGHGTFAPSSDSYGFVMSDAVKDVLLDGLTFDGIDGIYSADSTHALTSFRFTNNVIKSSERGVLLGGSATDVVFTGNRLANIVNANSSRATYGFAIGNGTQTNADAALRLLIADNHFNTITNNFAASTHAIVAYAQDMRIHDNTIKAVSNLDNSECEAIYVKSGRCSIQGNILSDMKASTNGAITSLGADYAGTGAPGYENIVSGNVITNADESAAVIGLWLTTQNTVATGNILKNCSPYFRDSTSSGLFARNVVDVAYSSATLAPTGLSLVDASNWKISGNRFTGEAKSLITATLATFLRFDAAAAAITSIEFTDNEVRVDFDTITAGDECVAAIQLGASGAALSNVNIARNTIVCDASNLAAGADENIFYISGTDPYTITGVRVVDNDFSANQYQYLQEAAYSIAIGWQWRNNWVKPGNLAAANYTMERQYQTRVDNAGAAANRSFFLPSALVGMTVEAFCASSSNQMTLVPTNPDTFTDASTSYILHIGQSLKLECFTAGIWHVVSQSVSESSITALTDNTGGSVDNTLANLANGTTYATDHPIIENNFADLAAKINEILDMLRGQ